MLRRTLPIALLAAAAIALPLLRRSPAPTYSSLAMAAQSVGDGLAVRSVAIGHEYRQDDWPSIAAAPDGSLWSAWLSFNGDRDDVALRHYTGNKWSNLMWVPATSGDSWMPQVGVDTQNRVWAVWSQQLGWNRTTVWWRGRALFCDVSVNGTLPCLHLCIPRRQIALSVSEGMLSLEPRPLADAQGYPE